MLFRSEDIEVRDAPLSGTQRSQNNQTSPDVRTSDSAGTRPTFVDLFRWFLESVGPAARLVWDEEFEHQLSNHPDLVRTRLSTLGISTLTIEELLHRAHNDTTITVKSCHEADHYSAQSSSEVQQPVQTPEPDLRNKNGPVEAYDQSREKDANDGAISSILLHSLGPMGNTLYDECRPLNTGTQVTECIINRLKQLEIDDSLIARVSDLLEELSDEADS